MATFANLSDQDAFTVLQILSYVRTKDQSPRPTHGGNIRPGPSKVNAPGESNLPTSKEIRVRKPVGFDFESEWEETFP